MGFEPTTFGTTIRRSNQLSYVHHIQRFLSNAGAKIIPFLFLCKETLTASSANNMPRRIQSPVTSWECPFIYLMGGYNDQGALLPYTWRGVYNRMTNYPVY